jgi:transposase-like protein
MMSQSMPKNADDPQSNTDLPPIETRRWSARRKAQVVKGVRDGAISLDEAYRRYQLSPEELRSWRDAIETYGVPGLRVTRLQLYRTRERGAQS